MTIQVKRFCRPVGGDHYAVRTTECNVCGRSIEYETEGAHHCMASHLKQSDACREAYNRYLEDRLERKGITVGRLTVADGGEL